MAVKNDPDLILVCGGFSEATFEKRAVWSGLEYSFPANYGEFSKVLKR